MSRYLLVVPPLAGHLAPLNAVAAELAGRGHHVAWAGARRWLDNLISPGARPQPELIFDCAADAFVPTADRPAGLRGASALKFLIQDYLVPLAAAMLPGAIAAIQAFRPDVVVVDQQAYAGAMAAHRLGVTWATSASTSAELISPFSAPVGAWVRAQLDDMSTRSGTAGIGDPRFSDHLVLAFTTPDLAGSVAIDPDRVRFVGPAIGGRQVTGWQPPWPDATDLPVVLVTLGTVNDDLGGRFLNVCAEALAGRNDIRAVIADPAGHLGPQPPTIAVARHVHQLEILAQAALVVCHAGHNTVCETLWHGLPLVVAPIRDDQPLIAEQVVTAGAGIRLSFTRANTRQVVGAVGDLLADSRFADAARAIQHSFRRAGGSVAAATYLELLTPS